MAKEWHIITCGYPDDPGGVSDYSYHLARALPAEDSVVHVWCPGSSSTSAESTIENQIFVHRVLGKFGVFDMVRTGQMLNQFPPKRRLLVQWVPHGYGYRSVNVFFCFWLLKRAFLDSDQIDLIVHETFLPFQKGDWKQNTGAILHRIMSVILLQAAERVWVTITAWKRLLSPLRLVRKPPIQILPVASNVPRIEDPAGILELRRQFAPNGFLIGHFGTYERSVTRVLEKILPGLGTLSEPLSIILFGKGSNRFFNTVIKNHPDLEKKVLSLDYLSPKELSRTLSACDLLVQPYPEGANTRRGTLMAGLSHGVPIVSTFGPLTDDILIDSPAMILTPHADPDAMVSTIQQLLRNSEKRTRMSTAARKLYQERFDWKHIVSALQSA